MKILPVVAELFHSDGQVIVDFSDFANALKNFAPASQQECLYVIRPDQLMAVTGIISVYSYKT
jgi:hypothetical protein